MILTFFGISPLRLSSKYWVIFHQGLSLHEAGSILKFGGSAEAHNIIIHTLPLNNQVMWESVHNALQIGGYIGFVFEFTFKNPSSGS